MNSFAHKINQNFGIQHCGNPHQPGPKTLIILGTSRGGTSACAGALSKLGVFMGYKSWGPTFEDAELSHAIEEQDHERIRETLNQYNSKHLTWGYKRPSLTNHVEQLHPLLRNPVYLAVFRDPVAIASRHSDDGSINRIRNIFCEYEKILSFLDRVRPDALLFSYEKMIHKPERFIGALCEVIHLNSITTVQKNEAIEFICPEPIEYLKNSRENPDFLGHLDSCRNGTIEGWACNRIGSASVQVDIFLNGIKAATVIANEDRADVKASGLHSSSRCGFTWNAPRLLTDSHSDTVITAAISGTDFQLNGSPMKLIREP